MRPWLRRQWLNDLAAIWQMKLPYQTDKLRTKAALTVVWKLPRWVVYWCGIRMIAEATTGRYGHTLVPHLTALDALKRWETSNVGDPEPDAMEQAGVTPEPPTVAG